MKPAEEPLSGRVVDAYEHAEIFEPPERRKLNAREDSPVIDPTLGGSHTGWNLGHDLNPRQQGLVGH